MSSEQQMKDIYLFDDYNMSEEEDNEGDYDLSVIDEWDKEDWLEAKRQAEFDKEVADYEKWKEEQEKEVYEK